MYQILFSVFALAGVLFFVLRKKIDPLAVAYGSCLIYFSPAFLGEVGFTYGGDLPGAYTASISPAAYGVMICVLALVIAAGYLYRFVPASGTPIKVPGAHLLPELLALLGVSCALFSAWRTGAYYMCVEKDLTLQHVDAFYYYAAYSIPTATIAALVCRKFLLAGVLILFLIADVYVGFRAELAMTVIAGLLVYGQRAVASRKGAILYVLCIVAVGASLFVVKEFIWSVKYLGSDACHSAVIRDSIATLPAELHEELVEETKASSNTDLKAQLSKRPDLVAKIVAQKTAAQQREQKASDETIKEMTRVTQPLSSRVTFLFSYAGNLQAYVNAFRSAEPFVIVSTLNAVATTGFSTDRAYLGNQLLSGVPGGKLIFGIDVSGTPTFNKLVQEKLFSDVPFGMANNPWAQALAAGGFFMVVLFGLGYAGMGMALTWLFDRTEGPVRAAVAVVAAWFVFYSHRNDLITQIGILKHVVYLTLIGLVCCAIFNYLRKPAHRAA